MSLLLKRWRCLDDLELLANEDEYRAHTAMFPNHRVVVEEPEEPPIYTRWTG